MAYKKTFTAAEFSQLFKSRQSLAHGIVNFSVHMISANVAKYEVVVEVSSRDGKPSKVTGQYPCYENLQKQVSKIKQKLYLSLLISDMGYKLEAPKAVEVDMNERVIDPRELLDEYESHKVVRAAKVVSIGALKTGFETLHTLTLADVSGKQIVLTVTQKYMDKHTPFKGGYFVLYEDGYESFSPAEPFEKGNSLIVDDWGDGVGEVETYGAGYLNKEDDSIDNLKPTDSELLIYNYEEKLAKHHGVYFDPELLGYELHIRLPRNVLARDDRSQHQYVYAKVGDGSETMIFRGVNHVSLSDLATVWSLEHFDTVYTEAVFAVDEEDKVKVKECTLGLFCNDETKTMQLYERASHLPINSKALGYSRYVYADEIVSAAGIWGGLIHPAFALTNGMYTLKGGGEVSIPDCKGKVVGNFYVRPTMTDGFGAPFLLSFRELHESYKLVLQE